MAPRQVIVKVLTVNKPIKQVFDFFSDVKNMEIGGAIKSVSKGENGWWQFNHTVAGNGRMKITPVSDFGILDHEFVDLCLTSTAYLKPLSRYGIIFLRASRPSTISMEGGNWISNANNFSLSSEIDSKK